MPSRPVWETKSVYHLIEKHETPDFQTQFHQLTESRGMYMFGDAQHSNNPRCRG